MKNTLLAAASLALLGWGSVAHAGLMVTTAADGELANPRPYDEATMLASSSYQAATSFQAGLVAGSQKTLDFEGLSTGTGYPTDNNLPVQFKGAGPAASASLTGTGRVDNTPNTGEGDQQSFTGRFNTTVNDQMDESNFWETTGNFELKFSAGVSFNAFGFYGTDLGDFDGSLALELWSGGSRVDSLTLVPGAGVLTAAAVGDDTGEGTLRFFGITNDTAGVLYDEIRFIVTQSTLPGASTDALGFDDFFIGMVETDTGGGGGNVPEPGSLALVGASLLALTAARRRRRA